MLWKDQEASRAALCLGTTVDTAQEGVARLENRAARSKRRIHRQNLVYAVIDAVAHMHIIRCGNEKSYVGVSDGIPV